MRKLKIITVAAILVFVLDAGWQIGARELANIELRDDLKDMSSQLAARIALSSAKSDEDFRNDILNKAKKYQIPLQPQQVTVRRSGEGFAATMYFAADYTVPVNLPGVTFNLHFHPESGQKLQ